MRSKPSLIILPPVVLGIIIGSFFSIYILYGFVLLPLILFAFKKIDAALWLLIFVFFSIYTNNTKQRFLSNRIRVFGIYCNGKIISLRYNTLKTKIIPLKEGSLCIFSGKAYRYNGIKGIKKVKIEKIIPSPFPFIYRYRENLIKKIEKKVGGEIGGVVKAISLGERDAIPSFIKKRFRYTGAAHLLSVSGLHTGIFFLIFFIIFRSFGLKKKWALILSDLTLIPFLFLTLLRVSVVRAVIMTYIFTIGEILERKSEHINVLSSAAIILLIISPLSVFETGFQLSFLAVAGIILSLELFKPQLNRIKNTGLKNWLVIPFLSTTSAQTFTLPIVAYRFGYIPVYSFITNIFFIPLVTLLLSGTIFFLFIPFLTEISSNFVWFIGFIMNKVMMAFQRLPHSVIILERPSLYLFLVYPLLLLFIFIFYRFSTRSS